MLYDQYFIDDLKNRADIVRIIQPYAQDLKKKGANWMACCPFHQEKTPSFSVNPSKGFYKCFGCGKGGSVYNFLMEIEGLNFPEAIKRVAEISGVMLPEPIDDKSYEISKKKKVEKKKISDEIIELNKIALEFWETELQAKNAKAKAAREYLQKRGISEETQKAFHVGFSPDKWDGLLNLLKEKDIDEKLIEQSGLVSVNEEKERVFDRFRGRIMFPVLDVNGNPVAFGARAMGSDEPKYLNSPETPAYIKGEHLYGLFQSKNEIRQKKFAILVEGYLDLIALYQFGITNAAASLGTAFTPEQSKLLRRFTRQVVVNFDGDRAGIEAARKSVHSLLNEAFQVKIFVIPEGKDPDDFIRENGVAEYDRLRGKAQHYIDFFGDHRVVGHRMSTPHERTFVAEQMLGFVRSIPNPTEKREAFHQIARLCSISESGQKELLKLLTTSGASSESLRSIVDRSLRPKVTVAEQRLLELLVFDSHLRDVIVPQLETSDYENLATVQIFAAFIMAHEAGKETSPEAFLENLDDDETSLELARNLLSGKPRREKDEALDDVLHQAENCVFSLRNMAIADRIMEISREATLAEQAGNEGLFNQLTFEQLELEKVRRELQRRIVEL